MNQTVAAMCGTFKVLVEDEYHMKNCRSVTVLGLIPGIRDVRVDKPHSKSCKVCVAYTTGLVPFGETVAGHFPQKHRKKMKATGIWASGLDERAQKRAERYNKKTIVNATGLPWDQRPPRDHADGGPFEGRAPPRGTPGQSDEQLADRSPGAELAQFYASCGQTPGCPGMVGNKTRISPHGGLQSKSARVARPTGIRRNGNIRTGTIRTNAGVKNHAGGPSTSSHTDSWR